ncbi:MAG: tetratricopeptide repeat protein [Saprospiraceae bacterium]
MNHKINLQSIRKYNPGLLKDEDVINNFLVRQKTFGHLINLISNEDKSSIPQHYLIIGQRGMGKTTLLKRIEVEIRTNKDLSTKYVALQFPEELYNVDRLSKFWLNTIDVFLDYLELSGNMSLYKIFDVKLKQLIQNGENESLSEMAYQLFIQIIKEISKRPILLIDNLDLVFEGLKEEEQWQLREKMSKSGAPIFIGASAAPFDAVFEYKQAFYDYFKLVTLDPLTYQSFSDLIMALAQNLENETIESSFQLNKKRIKTLYNLTGGNIRTAIILFASLSSGFGDNISDDLEKLLDEVTPIYKARIDQLSDQMRIIADAIALYWDPIDLQQLREITLLENNTLSPQIRRLRQLGWISKTASKKTKGDKYEMTERFFNVWYMMRRSSRRHRKYITYLSRFIDEFYGDNVTNMARSKLSQPILKEHEMNYRLALSKTSINKRQKTQINDQLNDNMEYSIAKEPSIPYSSANKSNLANKIHEYFELLDNERYNKAADWLEEHILLFPKSAALYFYKGYLNHVFLHNYETSKDSYLKAVEMGLMFAGTWNNLGNLYGSFYKNYEDAKQAYLKAIELDPDYAYAWNGLGNLYHDHFKKYQLAIDAYKEAIRCVPNLNLPKFNLIFLMRDILGEKEEALTLLNNIDKTKNNEYLDIYFLHQSLFQVYDLNFGLASESLNLAIEILDWNHPFDTFDDWVRYAAVAIKKGFGAEMIRIFTETKINILMRPYFEACVACQHKDEFHFQDVAAEVRDIAKEIYDQINNYMVDMK